MSCSVAFGVVRGRRTPHPGLPLRRNCSHGSKLGLYDGRLRRCNRRSSSLASRLARTRKSARICASTFDCTAATWSSIAWDKRAQKRVCVSADGKRVVDDESRRSSAITLSNIMLGLLFSTWTLSSLMQSINVVHNMLRNSVLHLRVAMPSPGIGIGVNNSNN